MSSRARRAVRAGLTAILFCLLSFLSPNQSFADDFEWSVPLDGFFISPGPWTRLTGTSSAPPGAGDLAIFNEAGTYTATFTNNRTTEFLEITAGEVTFRSSGTNQTYSLSEDATINGGQLNLGVNGDPLDLDVADALQIHGGGRVDVLHGSDLEAGRIQVGTNIAGDGTLLVDSGTLTTTSTSASAIGSFGSNGQLLLNNSVKAILGSDLNVAVSNFVGTSASISQNDSSLLDIDGDLNLVTGANTDQSAFFTLLDDSILTVRGDFNLATGTSANQAAFFALAGAGTQFSQLGTGGIEVGSTSNSIARLDVNNGTFSSGTGTINVNPTGIIQVAQGSFTANGPIVLDTGGTLILEDGEFEAKNGLDISTGANFENRNGVFTVSGGTFETPNETFVVSGSVAGEMPKLVVTSGATAEFNKPGLGPQFHVGRNGTDGEFEVSGGAFVTLDNPRLGSGDPTSTGTMTVTGSGTLVDSVGGQVGTEGIGFLNIGGGARVEGFNVIGTVSGSDGTVEMRGFNSTWDVETLSVGLGGTGLARISQGTLTAVDVRVGSNLGSLLGQGELRVVGAGKALVANDLDIAGNGTGPSGGTGAVDVASGRLEVAGTIFVRNMGTMKVRNSLSFVSADIIDHTAGGVFDFQAGTLQVTNFLGNLLNQGGTLAPGPDAGPSSIVGDYTQQPDATLSLEIGGTSPGGDHDVVSITGTATLDGTLELELIEDFLPTSADEFVVLSATSLSGFFDNIFTGQRYDLPGGEGSFVVNYGVGSAFPSNQIVLSDFLVDLPADRDLDGDVDGADFLDLQRTSPSLIPTWQIEYGSGTSLLTLQAVPEPSALVIGVLMLLPLTSRLRLTVPQA